MESPKNRGSEAGDAEDIPSDFFDDFSKAEFMEGLSVIDSWDEGDRMKRRNSRINMETLDSVKDLRELIREGKEDETRKNSDSFVRFDNRFKWVRKPQDQNGSPQRRRRSGSRKRSGSRRRSGSGSRLDEYIKPGSRRDPSKTNAAIKRDKEVKVKEYLAKHLEDDLRPPGTELDDYFGEEKPPEKKKSPVEDKKSRPAREDSKEKLSRNREPSNRERRSPKFYHQRNPGWVQRRSPMRSPRRYSPHREVRRRYSPPRRSPRRHSPHARHRSPRRYSPRRSRRSRSPQPFRQSYHSKRSRSRSPVPRDSFLYPPESVQSTSYPASNPSYEPRPVPFNAGMPTEYPINPGYIPEPTYPQEPGYSQVPPGYGGAFSGSFDYGVQPVAHVPVPQPVPAPVLNALPGHDPNTPIINPTEVIHSQALAPALNTGPPPPMLPSPAPTAAPPPVGHQSLQMKTPSPYDALAQLVAEGKLSKEDYLKLAPNKGATSVMDNKTRVMVLTRCTQAMGKLKNLVFPNRLLVNTTIISQEQKRLAPKFCSPLKRQDTVEFQYTKAAGTSFSQQNKQLIDRIVATLGMEKIAVKTIKKTSKNMKDAAVQTTKPFCEVCEIRDSMQTYDSSTSTDPSYFTSSIHTQVVEHDLVNSKSVFNPSGGMSEGATMSIAHMTPAQLVSQLAARAKSLKQTSDPPPATSQYGRRNPPSNYDYDGRGGGASGGGQQYKNNYNQYRY